MPGYLAALTIVLTFGTVLVRALTLKRQGIRFFHFGKLDKTDFLIPPFAILYIYSPVGNIGDSGCFEE